MRMNFIGYNSKKIIVINKFEKRLVQKNIVKLYAFSVTWLFVVHDTIPTFCHKCKHHFCFNGYDRK